MTQLLEILRTYLEEQVLMKYCVTNHLTLLKTQNMIDKQILVQLFNKQSPVDGIKNDNIGNQRLVEQLQKPIIIKFEKRKVRSSFMENVLIADLAHMKLKIIFHKSICFLLYTCLIYLLTWKQCQKHYNGYTTDDFRYRWENYLYIIP